MRARARASAAAELRVLTRGRRQAWVLAVAVGGSAVAGLANAAIAAQLAGVGAVELQTMLVSRGAATPLAVVLLMVLAVAGPYRDGSWLQSALAEPLPLRRLLIGAAPALGICLALALISIAAAVAAAAPVARVDPASLVAPASLHLAVTAVWSLWMLCLAHATRSPMLTLVIGGGLPVVVEPAIAGLLAQASTDALRWLLPGQALRAIGELPATGGALIQPVPAEALPLAWITIGACTGVLAVSAWLRMRCAQPR